MELPVYNLEFRDGSTCLEVDGYTFRRAPDYAVQRGRLQWLVNTHGPEFVDTVQTGAHAQTATVTCPEPAAPPVISWLHPAATALEDILVLLRLFTRRDVFAVAAQPVGANAAFAIQADPRMFPWGSLLECSIPYVGNDDVRRYVDSSVEVHLPKIYERMKDQAWQRQYKGGYFLVLLSQAIQQRSLEAAFGQCWTIWEHLFACLTDSWMSNGSIRQLSAKEKLAFILVHFEARANLREHEKSRLDDLVRIRNRLIHFGQFPERDAVHSDAALFIRMTEYITAKALGLFPSNIFNTVEGLEEFLANKVTATKR